VKQMKLIYMKGFTDDEREPFIPIIYSNVIMSMRALVLACEKLGLEFSEESQVGCKEWVSLCSPLFLLYLCSCVACFPVCAWSFPRPVLSVHVFLFVCFVLCLFLGFVHLFVCSPIGVFFSPRTCPCGVCVCVCVCILSRCTLLFSIYIYIYIYIYISL
jgi:hypothetical protein